jgi:hypothetical protein
LIRLIRLHRSCPLSLMGTILVPLFAHYPSAAALV